MNQFTCALIASSRSPVDGAIEQVMLRHNGRPVTELEALQGLLAPQVNTQERTLTSPHRETTKG